MHANNKIKQNQRSLDLTTQKLTEELRKPIIKFFLKRTVYSWFKDNIWAADLADMHLINNKWINRWFRILLCVIDTFSKYAWVVLFKDKGITITNAFQKILK